MIHIGQRDEEEARSYNTTDIRDTGIRVYDLAQIRAAGLETISADVIRRIHELPVAGCWIHLDTDVISDEENPAVDYRLPGGLNFDEVTSLLTTLLHTGRIAGMSISIFNPSLDKTGEIAHRITGCILDSFSTLNYRAK